MVLMSTGSVGGGRVGWGVHQSSLISRDGTRKENILSVIDRLLTPLGNASTLMLHLSSKRNKVARMTIYILHDFWLLEQLDHFFLTIKEIIK